MDKIPCEKCGEDFNKDDLIQCDVVRGQDDYDVVYYCSECFNRLARFNQYVV